MKTEDQILDKMKKIRDEIWDMREELYQNDTPELRDRITRREGMIQAFHWILED